MKICLISSLYGISGGGAGLAVEQLARGLSARTWDVFVITTKPVRKIEFEQIGGIRIFSIPSYNIYPLHDKENNSIFLKIFWQLIDIYNPMIARALGIILSKETPDLIHIHKMRGLSGAVWTVSARYCPERVVQTCHDYESMSPIGTLLGKIGDWAYRGHWLLWVYQKVRACLSKKVKVVTSPSKFTLNLITSRLLFPLARKEYVSNSHGFTRKQLDQIRSNQKVQKNEETHFLYLGRLESEKGVRELCTAFSSIVHKYPGVKLSMAGWGSLEEELRGKYTPIRNIIFVGRAIGVQKHELISNADALIIPSTYPEISPLVILEAYAYGKPVIAFRAGGLPELITEGVTGWLVEGPTSQALADAMQRFISTPFAFSSNACFNEARKYALENMISQYETIYLGL